MLMYTKQNTKHEHAIPYTIFMSYDELQTCPCNFVHICSTYNNYVKQQPNNILNNEKMEVDNDGL